MLKPDGDLKVVTEPISEKIYREKSFHYDPGEERSNVLNITLPSSIRSIRNTALSEVGCFIGVNLSMGLFRLVKAEILGWIE